MKKLSVCLVGLLVVVSLAIAQSASDVKGWAHLMKPIMRATVPGSLSSKGTTEEKYFSSLDYAGQVKYMSLFWQARQPGLKGEYHTRADYLMEKGFNADSDIGQDILLLGIPKSGMPEGDAARCVLKWDDNGTNIFSSYNRRLNFGQTLAKNLNNDKYHQTQMGDVGDTWHREGNNPATVHIASKFITPPVDVAYAAKCIAQWAPTEDGWKLLAEAMKEEK